MDKLRSLMKEKDAEIAEAKVVQQKEEKEHPGINSELHKKHDLG